MGQAKRRGSFEQRKQRGIEHRARELAAKQAVAIRRPSPKHITLQTTIAAALAEHPKLAKKVLVIDKHRG